MAALTLEQFTTSPTPIPTILLPRSQALRLVELCELAEMAPPSGTNFLDIIGVNDGSSSSNHGESSTVGVGGESGSANPHVLTTQMALLLYLGEYTHARHLWRRHRKTPAAAASASDAAANPETSNNADEGETNAASNSSSSSSGSSSDGDYAQLEQLWNAAKYIYLWSTGGIHSLTSSSSSSSTSSTDENEMMQVETNTNTDSSSSNNSSDTNTNNGDDLPFSTMALRALEQQSSSKNIEPLATYSTELLGVFRSRVNRSLHESFEKLSVNEFNLRMNLNNDSSAEGEGEEGAWNAFGWKKEGEYLISDVDVVLDDDSSVEEGRGNEVLEGGDRIGKLTEVVMFLEGKMNA